MRKWRVGPRAYGALSATQALAFYKYTHIPASETTGPRDPLRDERSGKESAPGPAGSLGVRPRGFTLQTSVFLNPPTESLLQRPC